ncbi:hypothetical protein D3C73_1461930 [compost metagenome]
MSLFCRLHKRLIGLVADINNTNLIILAVETAQHRLVIPLKIMDPDQLRNRGGL